MPRPTIKITPKRKSGRSSVLRELPKIRGPFNISVMAEDNDFKFSIELGFAKSNYKIIPKDKSGRAPRLGSCQKFEDCPLIFMQWLKLAISNLVHSLGLPIRPIIESDNETNHKSQSQHGSVQNLAFPFNIFVMADVAMAVRYKWYYTKNCKY